ncbi:hypothetical protein DP49_5312 [Burkholderia pseudomallei]|nr:hypothetical protein DP49_5312 [Burkholderia pseudomallei]
MFEKLYANLSVESLEVLFVYQTLLPTTFGFPESKTDIIGTA